MLSYVILKPRLNIGCDDIQWTDRLKYLGITVCTTTTTI